MRASVLPEGAGLVKIYAISDLHGNTPEPPHDADALILAGDICPDFRVSHPHSGFAEQSAWLDTTFRSWLGFHGLPVVAIWGNHDFVGEYPKLIPDLPWTLLQDSGTTCLGGRRIWGTPWVPGLPYWAFYGGVGGYRLKLRAEAIPDGTDILVTHGPPYYFGDYIPTSEKQRNKYGNFGGEHVGDKTLNAAIRRVKPSVTVCGHIHEARGTHKLDGEHLVQNVAAVDAFYKLVEDPWVSI